MEYLSRVYVAFQDKLDMKLISRGQEQINDLQIMSREYERQEAARMANRAYIDGGSRQSSEPYINELIPVSQHSRRRPAQYDARRSR